MIGLICPECGWVWENEYAHTTTLCPVCTTHGRTSVGKIRYANNDMKTEHEPDFKCGTFKTDEENGISPELRARMDADREAAQKPKVRQFQKEYKITHSCVEEMAAYLLRGWPQCCGKMSISRWIITFTEDVEPDPKLTALQAELAEAREENKTLFHNCSHRTQKLKYQTDLSTERFLEITNLKEQLTTVRQLREHEREVWKAKDAEIERLRGALEEIIGASHSYGKGKDERFKDIEKHAREALRSPVKEKQG